MIDKTQIYIKAGNGGNGCTSFFTEKFIIKGGPDGGDGGKGGDVYFAVDKDINSLIDFSYKSKHFAEDGFKGEGRFCAGKSGKDRIIKVPQGTIIKDIETGGVLADLSLPDSKICVLNGGSGGKGNARFKTSRRRSPFFSQSGQITEAKFVQLELKLLADVGLIGYPNVGKSTLLSVISNAKPKIANYHFTTLAPTLGVVQYNNASFVVADIPGLIEGASGGAGLGHDFLKHISRTKLLIHVIDISGTEGRDPVLDYKVINTELKKYDKRLSKLKQIIVLNKCDITSPQTTKNIADFNAAVKGKKIQLSAISKMGTEELIKQILKTLPACKPLEEITEFYTYPKPDINHFEITRDDDGAFVVFGGLIDELSRNVVIDNTDSFNFFSKKLIEYGIIKALKAKGAVQGNTVRIMDVEFEYVD